MFIKIRHAVFWPTLTALILSLVFSLYDEKIFLEFTGRINQFILDYFSFIFSTGTILLLIAAILFMISPAGRIRIGGEHAKPILSRWRWFSIILCTTVATGILFWGMAEPMYHFTSPPESLGIEANSDAAAVFSMSTMYLHWSFTPYAIYVIPSVMFALAFFNAGKDYSISSMLYPITGNRSLTNTTRTIDTIALFALVSGMAASLGSGILTLSGGLDKLFGLESSFLLLAVICFTVVLVFILSALSGLLKGIRLLSDWNVRIFFLILLVFIIFGPMAEVLSLSLKGFGLYVSDFVSKSTFTGQISGDDWPKEWTMFNWANWMAWAPVTALFLGNLGYGRTVREYLIFNWILPASFSIIWMSVFSGTALLYQEKSILDLASMLQDKGPESLIYAVMDTFPGGFWISILFFIAVFISFVTAADSSTIAMSALSTEGMAPENPDPPKGVKILWGVLVGTVSLIMVGFAGIKGIKMLSTIGGFPISIIILGIAISAIWLSIKSFRKKNGAED